MLKRFQFFDKDVATRADGVAFNALEGINVAHATSGRGIMFFGSAEGYICAVTKELEHFTFQVHDAHLMCMIQLRTHGIVVTAGRDENTGPQTVKVWSTEKVAGGNMPTLLRTVTLAASMPAITTMAAHEGLRHLVLGFVDGSVRLVQGDITRERSSSRSLRELFREQAPITGLGFQPALDHVFLFITTEVDVYGCSLDPKRPAEKLTTTAEGMKSHGTALNCFAISPDGALWTEGDSELNMFLPEGRGKSLPFPGKKLALRFFRNYLVIVHKQQSAARQDDYADASISRVCSVTVCDPQNKFIAYETTFDDVRHVLYEWSSIFVLTTQGKLFQLSEKDFESKMEYLYKKHSFEIAISLAKEQAGPNSEDSDTLAEIYTQYANDLYKKRNFDDAVRQYIKTIGKLEPSYVIRRFLDSQRIHNLTEYLQALHDRQRADKHHTTLLLNCYTKLKNVQKLDEFIMTDKELNFDLETAITVCRQAGYYKHALFLAKRFGEHEWYLRIQLENVHNAADALKYIACLPFPEAKESMQQFGKQLVAALPNEATELLKRLCTDYKPNTDVDVCSGGGRKGRRNRSKPPADPEDFIQLFVDNVPQLRQFLQYMVENKSDMKKAAYDTLLELYLREKPATAAEEADRDARVMALLRSHGKYDEYQAMILTQMYDFKEGILYLFGRTKQYQQIVRYYMEKKAYADVISACRTYGAADTALWVQALEFFAGDEEGCRKYMKQVLEYINDNNLLPPLMVIEILARNDMVTLASVKDYFTKRLNDEMKSIDGDERQIQRYRGKSEAMRAEIEQLRTQARVFQDNKCSQCPRPLTLPVVHFLCGHSYHWDCIPNENECTRCRDEHHMVMTKLRSHEQAGQNYDQLSKRLDGAKDRFSVIAEQFGQNMFHKPVTLPESAVRSHDHPTSTPAHAPPSSSSAAARRGGGGGVDDSHMYGTGMTPRGAGLDTSDVGFSTGFSPMGGGGGGGGMRRGGIDRHDDVWGARGF
ncbi:hypothetical protein PTSG_07434 [Salpingoeca rosetta]|uniref:Vacuolar protein sorting-associated protein 11 homolog n=1 Tax=Salpingoeca rosetta (strain ATCC 50818 / BSB-021) TaxID=946362 RepID=F2UIP7_SALR5|nr:uncharacterized protein PTSG_07434 [Salpingoeca rosetta]EGD77096.1 hypothetical protein PTSG_07434 [Salpingoeca rosetta]|eukprot:XP_004990935.1 hypothetical protein PTSG_07434 [Salpingoeca rosetta]